MKRTARYPQIMLVCQNVRCPRNGEPYRVNRAAAQQKYCSQECMGEVRRKNYPGRRK